MAVKLHRFENRIGILLKDHQDVGFGVLQKKAGSLFFFTLTEAHQIKAGEVKRYTFDLFTGYLDKDGLLLFDRDKVCIDGLTLLHCIVPSNYFSCGFELNCKSLAAYSKYRLVKGNYNTPTSIRNTPVASLIELYSLFDTTGPPFEYGEYSEYGAFPNNISFCFANRLKLVNDSEILIGI